MSNKQAKADAWSCRKLTQQIKRLRSRSETQRNPLIQAMADDLKSDDAEDDAEPTDPESSSSELEIPSLEGLDSSSEGAPAIPVGGGMAAAPAAVVEVPSAAEATMLPATGPSQGEIVATSAETRFTKEDRTTPSCARMEDSQFPIGYDPVTNPSLSHPELGGVERKVLMLKDRLKSKSRRAVPSPSVDTMATVPMADNDAEVLANLLAKTGDGAVIEIEDEDDEPMASAAPSPTGLGEAATAENCPTVPEHVGEAEASEGNKSVDEGEASPKLVRREEQRALRSSKGRGRGRGRGRGKEKEVDGDLPSEGEAPAPASVEGNQTPKAKRAPRKRKDPATPDKNGESGCSELALPKAKAKAKANARQSRAKSKAGVEPKVLGPVLDEASMDPPPERAAPSAPALPKAKAKAKATAAKAQPRRSNGRAKSRSANAPVEIMNEEKKMYLKPLMKSNDIYHLESYWTRTTCGVRRRVDDKHMFLASEPKMLTNIKICNYVAAWLAEHHDEPDLLSPELAEGVEKIISNSAED